MPKNSEKEGDYLRKFDEHLGNKYQNIMKRVGSACGQDIWPPTQWTHAPSTEADLRTYLLTACSFVLKQETEAVIENTEESQVVTVQSKNIGGLLSLRDNIQSYTGIDLGNELDRALLRDCLFGLVDIPEGKRKMLGEFIQEAKEHIPQKQGEEEQKDKYIMAVTKKTIALSTPAALGLLDVRYKSLCEAAKSCSQEVVKKLVYVSNSYADDDAYAILCNKAKDLTLQEVPKMTQQLLQPQQQPENQVQQKQRQQNLRRYGKVEGEDVMMEELWAANIGKEDVLEEIMKKAQGGSGMKREERQDGAKRSGKVEVIGEVHDEHGASVGKLVEKMEKMSDEEGKRSVIALERKEGGEHLGMRDVRLLAEVMRYNEGKKDAERIALPAGVEGTALWWDAKLVSEAQKHGVQVVGVEGKSLAHGQQSPKYNVDREDYMAQQLHQLKQQGYNVVMPVREAHVKGLQSRLGADVVVDTMGTMQQNSQGKEHDISQLSVNAAMEAMQQSNKQDSQSNGQSTSHATQTTAKKVYGKFTEHLLQHSFIFLHHGLGM